MEARVRKFFAQYERCFNQALRGDMDMKEIAALYASEFIAASPAGIMAGRNDEQFKGLMTQGYARYRDMGTKDMRIREIRVSPLDSYHCVAHVGWMATYSREDQADVAIHFDVHYFVQQLDGKPKVFGWVSGDETAILREHGVI